jgi:hypothetical protein
MPSETETPELARGARNRIRRLPSRAATKLQDWRAAVACARDPPAWTLGAFPRARTSPSAPDLNGVADPGSR